MPEEKGHEFLARLGKTRLRPGGKKATDWLLGHVNFTPELKVLEVACNMGTNLVALAKEYKSSFTGLDMNAAALEKARTNVVNAGLNDRVTLIEGDATALPFADESFDVVINEAMLTMLPGEKKAQAIAEYRRVLKPNGIILTHDVCVVSDNEIDAGEIRGAISRAINAHVEPLTLTGWLDLFRSAGFSVEETHDNMTLLDPIGMVHDEGFNGAMNILRNALQPENVDRFRKMFTYFLDNRGKLNYIAVASTKK